MIRLGWCRNVDNRQVTRIRQVFKWAVENELVSASVTLALPALAIAAVLRGWHRLVRGLLHAAWLASLIGWFMYELARYKQLGG